MTFYRMTRSVALVKQCVIALKYQTVLVVESSIINALGGQNEGGGMEVKD